MRRRAWASPEAARRRQRLAMGQTGLVIRIERADQLEAALDNVTARLDDARWDAHLRQPFTWQRFVDWWACRRWVRPRDIRAE